MFSLYIVGWEDPGDIGSYGLNNGFTVEQVRSQSLLRHLEVVNTTCEDPEWMLSNTSYPRG